MAKGRDKVVRKLQVEELVQFILDNHILVRTLFRYDGTQTFADPNDIPSLGFIQSLLGAGTVNDIEFSGSDVQDPTGNPYLVLSLTGTQRPFSVLVNGKTITTGEFDLADNKLYQVFNPTGAAWTVDDVIMVGVFGIPGEPITIPVINTQPSSKTVVRGRPLELSVVATNATGYQWNFNGVAIPGATSSNLSLPNMTSAMAGSYDVLVYNGSGSVLSTEATITYDGGIQLINFSQYKRTLVANGSGRVITFIDGTYSADVNPGYGGYISSSSTSIIIRQGGVDDLTFNNSASVSPYEPILGGNVDNTFNSPFPTLGAPIVIYNDN